MQEGEIKIIANRYKFEKMFYALSQALLSKELFIKGGRVKES
jgi:hypothetical protein